MVRANQADEKASRVENCSLLKCSLSLFLSLSLTGCILSRAFSEMDGRQTSKRKSTTSETPETQLATASSSHLEPSSPAFNTETTFVFTVTALDRNTVEKVKKRLHDEVQSLVETVDVKSDVVAIIGTEIQQEIMNLETEEVSINIGQPLFTYLSNTSPYHSVHLG